MNKEKISEILFYILVFLAITTFAIIQPFGDPPDEINRFKVVWYVCNHGTIPIGSDPEILLGGYGASYAFQPILTYIIEGWLLRFIRIFADDAYVLLLAARMVNVVFGVIMAVYVRKMSKLIFQGNLTQWLFTLLIVCLPQSLFLHSYVNTDSMAMLSVTMMIYALVRAMKDDFQITTCVTLSIGIILCALSYYNAYGMIICSILFFLYSFWNRGKVRGYDFKSMLKKGIFISVIVMVGIAWWFVRNAVIYDGDLLGLNARTQCAIQTATDAFNPETRFTYQKAGIPITEMIFGTGFITTTATSFIAKFGPMIINTHKLVYVGYLGLFLLGIIFACIPMKERVSLQIERTDRVRVFQILMIMDILISAFLMLYYSYTWEFQPQGRYLLPALIPFMYFVVIGVEKGIRLVEKILPKIPVRMIVQAFLCFFIMVSLGYSLIRTLIPWYQTHANMFELIGEKGEYLITFFG